jgi:hypothetical protein
LALAEWNDVPGRTGAEVLATLRACVEDVRQGRIQRRTEARAMDLGKVFDRYYSGT